MADWVDNDDYSRVDTEKVLNAADDLDKAVRKMRNALSSMEKALRKLSVEGDTGWSGAGADAWLEEYYDAWSRASEDVKKYEKFPKYMRDRVEVYIKAAIEAEETAESVNQDVRALLNDLLQETGGSARVRDIRAAHKAKSGS